MIFCIEEDELLRKTIIRSLQEQGYAVKAVAEFCENSCKESPALVIADMAGIAVDSGEFLEKVRKEFRSKGIPILYFLPRKNVNFFCDENTENEYFLEKPFDIKALLTRVSDIFNEKKNSDKRTLVYKEIRFFVEKNRVETNGSQVILTQKESALLYILMNSPGELFGKKRLFCEVWGSDYLGESRTVDVHIGTLRTKLGDAGKYIKNLRGKGYYIEKSEGEDL